MTDIDRTTAFVRALINGARERNLDPYAIGIWISRGNQSVHHWISLAEIDLNQMGGTDLANVILDKMQRDLGET